MKWGTRGWVGFSFGEMCQSLSLSNDFHMWARRLPPLSSPPPHSSFLHPPTLPSHSIHGRLLLLTAGRPAPCNCLLSFTGRPWR